MPELFCSSCVFYKKGACSIGKVAEGEDIRTVSDCTHRVLTTKAARAAADSTATAGDAPASQE